MQKEGAFVGVNVGRLSPGGAADQRKENRE